MSRSGVRSASGSRWDTGGRTPHTSRAARSSSGSSPGGSSAFRWTVTATGRSAWRCRRGSSTSAARRPRRTSAPRRSSSRSWRGCTPSTTGPGDCAASRSASASRRRPWHTPCKPRATRSCTACSLTRFGFGRPLRPTTFWPLRAMPASTSVTLATARSESRSTRPSPRPIWTIFWTSSAPRGGLRNWRPGGIPIPSPRPSPAPAATWLTRSSIHTTPRRRCCATSAVSSRATFR